MSKRRRYFILKYIHYRIKPYQPVFLSVSMLPHISDTIWHVASIVRYLGDMQMLEGRLMRNLPFPFPIQSNWSGVSMLIHDICMGREVIDTITQCSYGIDCQIIINSDFLGRFVCACYWNWNNDFIYFKEQRVFC